MGRHGGHRSHHYSSYHRSYYSHSSSSGATFKEPNLRIPITLAILYVIFSASAITGVTFIYSDEMLFIGLIFLAVIVFVAWIAVYIVYFESMYKN